MDQFANEAADCAMRAAVEYLRAHKLAADTDALVACLRSHVRAAVPAALHDAKQALDAHMDQIAEMTFRASMAQAGIEAAKEASFPAQVRP